MKRGVLGREIVAAIEADTLVDPVFIAEKKDGKLILTLEDPDFEDLADEIWESGTEIQVCRVCGCTDDRACPGGCYWVEEDLCSNCAEEESLREEEADSGQQ